MPTRTWSRPTRRSSRGWSRTWGPTPTTSSRSSTPPLDGELPLQLAGGPVGWAAGIQARNEQYTLDPDEINDLAVNPCPFRNPASIALGNTATLDCDAPTGLFAFLSGTIGETTERTVYGAFAEFALPVTDTFDVQLAARFEDYGGDVGSTIDPKLAVRWQVTPSVALRGSVSTTFRGPPQPFLQGRGTSLQFVGAVLAFKAVDTLGNPNLKPETADTANFGIILDRGPFYGSLDYWRFAFEDPFQVESFNAILGAYGSNGCEPGGAGVGSETCNLLSEHLVFQPGATGLVSEVQRFEVNWINGTDITTSGVDWLAQYDFSLGESGLLTVGTQGTHTLEYEVDDFRDINGVFLTEGGDFSGNLNDNRNQLTPLVDLQGNLFAKWSMGRHRVTAVLRYWGEYDDPEAIPSLQTIDSMTTVDVTYNVRLLNDALTLNLSAFNLLDEDPPRTQTDLNYDPYTHSAFGRMIKVGLVYQL
jgi:iron complex outermembrane receptor protein